MLVQKKTLRKNRGTSILSICERKCQFLNYTSITEATHKFLCSCYVSCLCSNKQYCVKNNEEIICIILQYINTRYIESNGIGTHKTNSHFATLLHSIESIVHHLQLPQYIPPIFSQLSLHQLNKTPKEFLYI